MLYIVGEVYAEGPPVPIPNTEVKLCRAEDTWLATARENRYSPTQTKEPVVKETTGSFLASENPQLGWGVQERLCL